MKRERELKRMRIVDEHKRHPELSNRKLAKRLKCSHSTVSKWVLDSEQGGDGTAKKQTGRPRGLSDTMLAEAVKMALSQTVASSPEIVCHIKQVFGIDISARTVSRALKRAGVVCGTAKKVPMLSANHKGNRVRWANRWKNSKQSFAGVMFTDSKYFLLNNTSGSPGPKVFYEKGKRPHVAVVKHSRGVHAYLGVTKYGVTSVVFATGGGFRKSKFQDTKTKRPYSGVCALEYQQRILPALVKGGNSLFASQGYWADRWIFQQDNAPAHKASGSVDEIIKLMGGNAARVELEWPPMSPDLSWIENVWAWAERELQKRRAGISDLEDLALAVEQILGSVPSAMLENYVQGMKDRLQKVITGGGAPIGK